MSVTGLRAVRDIGEVLRFTAAGAGTSYSSTARKNEINRASRGVRLTMVISAKSGTIDVVATIRRYDRASGTYIDMLSTASVTAAGTTVLTIHPDLTTAANSILKDLIGDEFDVKVVSGAGSSPSFTGTVGIELLA